MTVNEMVLLYLFVLQILGMRIAAIVTIAMVVVSIVWKSVTTVMPIFLMMSFETHRFL